MKSSTFLFFACVIAALVAAPLWARADAKASFENEGKQILSEQPGLIEYVDSRFQVKDTGIAKYPGTDDQPPGPPYIFRARQKGSTGPYNLRLLIQPGPPGHILGIVKDTTPTAPAKAPVSAPVSPAQQPLTSETPSGPITNSNPSAIPSNNAPASNLTPPPDPAPAPH